MIGEIFAALTTDFGMFIRGWRLALTFFICFGLAALLIRYLPMNGVLQIIVLISLCSLGLVAGSIWNWYYNKK